MLGREPGAPPEHGTSTLQLGGWRGIDHNCCVDIPSPGGCDGRVPGPPMTSTLGQEPGTPPAHGTSTLQLGGWRGIDHNCCVDIPRPGGCDGRVPGLPQLPGRQSEVELEGTARSRRGHGRATPPEHGMSTLQLEGWRGTDHNCCVDIPSSDGYDRRVAAQRSSVSTVSMWPVRGKRSKARTSDSV